VWPWPRDSGLPDVDRKEAGGGVQARHEWPSARCCSTLAGSVSPCDDETAKRKRCSPGTSVHTGFTEVVAKPTCGRQWGRDEDAPAVVGIFTVEMSPPRVVDRDGRVQENVESESPLTHLTPPREAFGLPLTRGPVAAFVLARSTLFGILSSLMTRGHGFVLRNRTQSRLLYRVSA
jgi:hypothetical protein